VRKKKNRTSSPKMEKRQHKVLYYLFNDPIRLPVNSEFMKKTSANSIADHIPGIATIYTTAWIQVSYPFNPTGLVMVMEASHRNVWYSFLYDVFIDGGCLTLGWRKYHPS
jgi:hypothetical protein